MMRIFLTFFAAAVNPSAATCQDVVWSIPAEYSAVAQISETGLLTPGNFTGTIQIEVVTTSTDGRYSKRHTITLNNE